MFLSLLLACAHAPASTDAAWQHVSAPTAGGISWAAGDAGLFWVNAQGAVIARAYNFDNGGDDFVEGFARYLDEAGKVGFLDESGTLVIPARWDFAARFAAGRAVVCEECTPEAEDEHARMEGGRWGAIDTTGAVVVPLDLPDAESAIDAAGRRSLLLDPAELVYDEAAGTVTFSPDSARQAAAYSHYVLDLASLEDALGGRPTAPVQVEVVLDSVEVRTETPADPSLPSPMGGFQITTWTGRVAARPPP